MKRYTWLLVLMFVLSVVPAPTTALALTPCPPTAAPTASAPSGNITIKRPTFSWSSVPGAENYTLDVIRVSDEATILHQTNITATSFTPTSDQPVNIDLRWKVKAESSCGPGPYSASVLFKILPP